MNLTTYFTSRTPAVPWAPPLIVELSEIRTAETEQQALASCPNPHIAYNHFVDDGIGAFKDKTHADYFLTYLNSRNTDLQYTIEHPQQDGSSDSPEDHFSSQQG